MYTAILHLREPVTPIVRRLVIPTLATIRGVLATSYDASEAIISVDFDGERASLPELVRALEDLGTPVAAVAQRQAAQATAD